MWLSVHFFPFLSSNISDEAIISLNPNVDNETKREEDNTLGPHIIILCKSIRNVCSHLFSCHNITYQCKVHVSVTSVTLCTFYVHLLMYKLIKTEPLDATLVLDTHCLVQLYPERPQWTLESPLHMMS